MTGSRIPLREIRFRTSRSGGPGGQNVNKVETRVEASWDPATSAALSEDERARLRESLGRRIGPDGRIRVVSQEFRGQSRNKAAAVERLRALVAKALRPRRTRRATRPTPASREARMEGKKRRAYVKRQRAARGPNLE